MNYPQVGLSKESVMPLALTLKCATSWNVSVEPSEPVPWSTKVLVAAKFRRLKFSEKQNTPTAAVETKLEVLACSWPP
jgi:hypothetical protein